MSSIRRFLGNGIPIAAVCVVYFSLRYTAMPETALQGLDRSDFSPITYLLTQFTAWWHYVFLWFAPVNQVADNSAYPVYKTLLSQKVLLSLLGWFVLFGLLIRQWKSNPEITLLGVAALTLLSPTSSFMPLAEMVNEHRPYLPLAIASGAWISAFWLWTNKTQERFFWITVLVFGLLMIDFTWQRNRVYQTSESYWFDVVQKAPSARAHNNYGLIFMARGKRETSLQHFTKAEEMAPYWFIPKINLGIWHQHWGDTDKAKRYFDTAVSFEGTRSQLALRRRAEFYKKTNQPSLAIKDLETIKALTNPQASVAAAQPAP